MNINNITNLAEYIPTDILVIMPDSEYGTHIYFKHGTKDLELSFYTESEDIKKIIEEIIIKIRLKKNND